MTVTASRRLTRVQRETYESVRRLCEMPLDSFRLRAEVAARTAEALPADFSAMATTDPEVDVFAHGMSWDYPAPLLARYYTHVYPQEAATGWMDLARSGKGASTDAGPVEAEYLREGGLGPKLKVALGDGTRLWGAWCLMRHDDVAPFSADDVWFAAQLAPMIATGLRQAALLEAAAFADAHDAHDVYDDAASPTSAPGVAVYDLRGRLLLRDERAGRYLGDLDDVGRQSELPASVAGALTQLRWRLACRDSPYGSTEGGSVRLRGLSGRWYAVHASASEATHGATEQAIVVITPLGGSERASVLARLYGLTPREREVVVRLAHGESGKQIAAALGLSTHTVQAHVDNACVRLGVRGRRELVARLFVDTAAARVAK